MNYRSISYILGRIYIIVGALMLLPLSVCFYYNFHGFEETSYLSFIIPIIILEALGIVLTINKPEKISIYAKEGFVICGLGWITMSAFGAIPFVISGYIPNFIDAFFETVSGFTTTGSSILLEVESIPKSILFWRSFTVWIGGMGILSFMIAIIPKAKGNSMFIVKAEVPGPTTSKVVSKISTSARILYVIYFFMTIFEIVILYVGTKITGDNIRFFDCVVNSFATAGTGGFTVLNKSILGYNSAFAEWVCTVFMFLFGVNFNLYYLFLTRKFSQALKDEELRAYVIINLTAVVLIIINIHSMYDSFSVAVRDAFFSVNTAMSTTGFCTANFDIWPTFSKVILLLVMCIGGCAGSTAGGIKVLRFELLFKQMLCDLRRTVRPSTVLNVRLNEKSVDTKIIRSVKSYLIVYLVIFSASLLIISIDNFDFDTSFSAVVACFNNIGPGLGLVGPVGNYSQFSDLSKLVLIFDMLAGRLELFPILLLFSPNTWRKTK